MTQFFHARKIGFAPARIFLTLLLLLAVAGTSAQTVISDPYGDPGFVPNRNYIQHTSNEYIDPFSGSLQYHHVDFHVPGNGGFDLKLIRAYSSAAVDQACPACHLGSAGLGWTMHFGRVLKPFSAFAPFSKICENAAPDVVGDNPALELPDGSRHILSFTGQASPLLLSNQRWRVDCSADRESVVAYSPDGLRHDMTHRVALPNGVLAFYATRITDRNGNFATIRYAAADNPEIIDVVTNDGRVASFSYGQAGLRRRLISQITIGQEVYRYQYRAVPGLADTFTLTQVLRPDGKSWTYSYNEQMMGSQGGGFLLNTVRFPDGGSVSYEYRNVEFDSYISVGRQTIVRPAISRKTSSSGGLWNFNYVPGRLGILDVTTVVAPSGTTIYQHYGPNFSAEGSGSAWMTGLLHSKKIGEVQIENYFWSKQEISKEKYFRPYDFNSRRIDNQTNAPVLTRKEIFQDGVSYATNYANFNAYGNPGTITELGPNGGERTTTLTYYDNFTKWIRNTIQDEQSPGNAVARRFDANGNLIGITRDGVTTSYAYDSQGNLAAVTFPRSLTHTYADYKRGIAQTESQPEGITIRRVVNNAGKVTSETNGEGQTSSYGYDLANRLTAIGYPIGSGVSIAYALHGFGSSRTLTRGALIETAGHDGFGNLTSLTVGGIKRTFSYDTLGRKVFESDPDSAGGTRFQYDILNRLLSITNADGSVRTITYGGSSRSVSDEKRGMPTVYVYRGFGDPAKMAVIAIFAADPSANVSLTRNARDLITSVSQGGMTRRYDYNANNYLISVFNPETGMTHYGRDEAGNMISHKVENSGTASYVYDGQNRLASVSYFGSLAPISRTYSRTNKLKTVVAASSARSYTYDANDNLTSDSLTVDGITLLAGYSWNDRDQLASMTYPISGRVVNYAPDVHGRPTQASGYVNSAAYWPSGQIKNISYTNGTVSNYAQNARLWPASFSTQKDGVFYGNSDYRYDAVGNLTSISDTTDAGYNRNLAYDAGDRLSGISGPWGAGAITYDGTGNITSQTLGDFKLFYNYDASNRLIGHFGQRVTGYTYDHYGNVLTGSGNWYGYDGASNLTCINCTSPTIGLSYGYDGLNRRISVIKAGLKSYEFYDQNGNQLIDYTPGRPGGLIESIYLGSKRVAQRVTP